MAHWRDFVDTDASGRRYLPWKEVARVTGLSRTTAWRLQKRDEFPSPYSISPGRVGFAEHELQAWSQSRGASARRGPCRAADPGPRPSPSEPLPAAPAAPPPQPPAAAVAPPAAVAGRQAAPPSPPPASATRPSPRPRRRSQHAKAVAQQMLLDF
jgi:predicted DNA-binding transcriptional regulator AlpA